MELNPEAIKVLINNIKELESSLVDALLERQVSELDALNELAQEAHYLQNIIIKINELYPTAKEPYDRNRF